MEKETNVFNSYYQILCISLAGITSQYYTNKNKEISNKTLLKKLVIFIKRSYTIVVYPIVGKQDE